MTIIVTDTGFASDDLSDPWEPAPGRGVTHLHLSPDANPEALRGGLADLHAIRIAFPTFSDGRGFTLAARLRRLGFAGRLRAAGHVIADQYAMARRAGFDEVEISATLAARQPEAQWLARADWRDHDHRSKLGRRSG